MAERSKGAAGALVGLLLQARSQDVSALTTKTCLYQEQRPLHTEYERFCDVSLSRLDPSRPRANSANTLSDGRGTQQASPCSIIIQPPTNEASSRSPSTHALLRGPLHNITKSKLRATHVHHGQVSNIIKDISNTGKSTIHNNTGKHESCVNNQHRATTWTDTVGSPQSPLLALR